MLKKKKPVRIGIIRTDDFIILSITMFNKTKWKVIRRDVMRFDMFCIAIMLMINFLLIGLARITELQWYERVTIAIIERTMIVIYIRKRKEIIEG